MIRPQSDAACLGGVWTLQSLRSTLCCESQQFIQLSLLNYSRLCRTVHHPPNQCMSAFQHENQPAPQLACAID